MTTPPLGYGPQWDPAGSAPQPGPVTTSTKAVVGLVLAVLAYTPVVPVVGAIGALVLAHLARRDILASGGRETGLGLVTATKVIAWVHIAFVALLLLALGVAVVVFGAFGFG